MAGSVPGMTHEATTDDATACEYCGGELHYGETGEESPDAGGGDVAGAVAYCPNPDCPGKNAGSDS
jgi:hypothetical protein